MAVTYWVRVSGDGIDSFLGFDVLRCHYSRVTSVSYTYSDYSIEPAVFAQ